MSRYEFFISGEDCGVIEADSIDAAVKLFTEQQMVGYDSFSSLGAWLEEVHRIYRTENDYGGLRVTNLETGMSIALEHDDDCDEADDQ